MTSGKIIIAIALVLVVFIGANFYLSKRIFQTIIYVFPHTNRLIYIIIYLFIVTAFIFGRAPLPLPYTIKTIYNWIAAHWWGFSTYLLMFFLCADIFLFVGNIIKIIPPDIFIKVRFYAGIAVTIVSVLIFCYGLYNANQIKLVS